MKRKGLGGLCGLTEDYGVRLKKSESLHDLSVSNAQHEIGIICAGSIEQGSTLRKL